MSKVSRDAKILGAKILVLLVALSFMFVWGLRDPKPDASISYMVIFDAGLNADYECSATPVAADAFLTATHCETHYPGSLDLESTRPLVPLPLKKIGMFCPHIKMRKRDGQGHSVIVLEEKIFTKWARVDYSSTVKDDEQYYFWGYANVYHGKETIRRGDLMGLGQGSLLRVGLYFGMNAEGGDSGAGIFNKHGQIVTTVEEAPIQFPATVGFPFGPYWMDYPEDKN